MKEDSMPRIRFVEMNGCVIGSFYWPEPNVEALKFSYIGDPLEWPGPDTTPQSKPPSGPFEHPRT